MTKSLLKKMMVAGFVVAALAGSILAEPAQAQSGFHRTDRVLPYDTDVWRVWVPAGSGRVVVEGGTHTDLDLSVYDESTGRLLAVDDDRTSYCIGDFFKGRSGWIEVRVENLGGTSNGYSISVR